MGPRGFRHRSRRLLVAWEHDRRTPIASMQAMLEAIEDGLADTEHYLRREPTGRRRPPGCPLPFPLPPDECYRLGGEPFAAAREAETVGRRRGD